MVFHKAVKTEVVDLTDPPAILTTDNKGNEVPVTTRPQAKKSNATAKAVTHKSTEAKTKHPDKTPNRE